MNPPRLLPPVLAGAAALLAAAAAVLSPNRIAALLGVEAPGGLAWGPALFRLLLVVNAAMCLAAARIARTPSAVPAVRGTVPRTPIWAWMTLGGLTLAAGALRLYGLDLPLWVDEILSLREFVRKPVAEILTLFPNQNQHMLYSLLARGSILLLGESAASLRLPAVLFGVASLWPLFLLGRRLLGVREALLTCALMTFSYHHVWFSQNARGYSASLFFTLLATWLWLEALEKNRRRWWAAYAVALAGGFWAQVSMAFVGAAHFLWWLFAGLRARRFRWSAVAAWAGAAGLTLQFYALSLPQFLTSALHEFSPETEWTNPAWFLIETFRSLQTGFAGPLAVLLAGILTALGWIRVWRREPSAAAVMVLPGLLVAATMFGLRHNLWPRLFFFLMGFALLCLIAGIVAVPEVLLRRRAERTRRAAGVAAALLAVTASAATVPRCYILPKQDFPSARDYVDSLRRPGDMAATVGLANIAMNGFYAPHWRAIETADQLRDLLQSDREIWLVYTLPAQIRGFQPGIWAIIQQQFKLERAFPGTLSGGEVYVCRRSRTA
ncbi:MAG TPA: glycosyltransferase family 39 protein [Bryobacteraceae bacterium]|nr:glycosyltransferase family 39 protein [Bryobacteraceae bacterium]